MTTLNRNGSFPADARGAAEVYLRMGLAPIPLPPRSKDPGYPAWQHLQVTTAAIDQHFPPQEARNVGILNGSPSSNTLDVDLDCDEARRAAPLLLPPTEWVFGRESAPRSHWIYRADRSPESAQVKYADLNGTVLVELRGTGGLTVFPPSTHKETGELIVWYDFVAPGEVLLGDLQNAVARLAAVALLARHWVVKGTRQDAFLALVAGLLRGGWPIGRVESFVEVLAAVTNDEEPRKRAQIVASTAVKLQSECKLTGWPTLEGLIGSSGEEVVLRVRQWLGMGQGPASGTAPPKKRVRELEPYRPFPVDALPAPIREFVRQGAVALGCDPAFLALPALAVAASVIGNTRAIRLKRGWEEPCILWTVIVSDSGTLKSPAFYKAVGHQFRLQKRLLLEYREKCADYQNQKREYEAAKRAAKENGTDPGEPPEAPVLPRVVVNDTTIEKLAEILEDNPRGTLVGRDELAGWLSSFCRYKGQKGGTDLQHWLEAHQGKSWIIDRKTTERKTIFVERVAVSITGGIQPAVLARALTPEFLDAGLAARLLMAMPPKRPKRWNEVEVAPDVEQAYHECIDRLLTLEFDTRDEEIAPRILDLSREAREAWIRFYNRWAREQAAAEGELAAAFSKLEAAAARFALIHHVVTLRALDYDDTIHTVGARSIEAGITLVHWFAREARRIYRTLTETGEERDARRLVEFIRTRGGEITVRRLQNSSSRKYPSADEARSALQSLVAAGHGEWVEQAPGPQGGRPAEVFRLLLTTDTTDETSLEEDDEDDGRSATRPADITPTPPEGCPGNGGETGVSSVVSVVGKGMGLPGRATGGGNVPLGALRDALGGFVGSPNYLLVKHQADLATVVAAIDGSARVGLDLETTGLDSRRDRVRLLSLATDTIDGGTFCYLIDCAAMDISPLWEPLGEKELILHNAAFDLAFLARLGYVPRARVHDTMLLAQLLTAGTSEKVSLAACCQRWLGRTLDKSEQRSDWSGELTDDQLAYAAVDVEVLAPLLAILTRKVEEAGLLEVVSMEQRCLPAVVWMGWQGVGLDQGAWQRLALEAADEAERVRKELNTLAPPKPEDLFNAWNWDSPQQAVQALTLAGCDVADSADETLAAVDHPLAPLLRQYRIASKKVKTYGAGWLDYVTEDSRVYPGWRQIGSRAGRMSCSAPNMQQLPRGDYRRCVVAPPGRVLVQADYSQIELRIAAKVSGDQALLAAYRRGDDLHVITARNVLGIEQVTKQDRQLAKALNFGLLYGMGASGFRQYAKAQYGLDLTEAEAARYRTSFFKSYPGLAAWHRRTGATGKSPIETRTLAGRRRLDVSRFTEKLNSPVQGTGADGLKLALALLWERRDHAPGAFPVLAVHDEIVVEAHADQSDAAAAWLRTAMIEGMAPLIEPVPVEVEVKVAQTWGG